MRRLVKLSLPAWALVALVAGLVFVSACDPGHEITFKNNTSTTIAIFFEGRQQGSVNPGESKVLTHLEYGGVHTWEARDEQGHVVYHANLSWSDIRDLNWTITITGTTNFRQPALPRHGSEPA